jgi:Glyoxalase-like domain
LAEKCGRIFFFLSNVSSNNAYNISRRFSLVIVVVQRTEVAGNQSRKNNNNMPNDDSDYSNSVFEDDGSDCDDNEDDDRSAVIKQKLALLKQNHAPEKDDDDDESDYEEEVVDDDDEEDDDDDEEDDDDDDDDDEQEQQDAEYNNNDVEEKENILTISNRPNVVVDDDGLDDDDDDDDDGNDEIKDTLKKKPKKTKSASKLAPITAITADDTEDDIAMKALLGEWGVGNDDTQVNDDDDEAAAADDDESSNVSERMVHLEDGVIDHIVLAAPNLEEAMEQFEQMTGIAAKIFGAINGIGIRCARISFNDCTYLEIIAPDPKQPGPIGQLIKSKGITDMTPFAYSIRSSRVEALNDEVGKFKYVPDHITMFGGSKDGSPRKWEMLHLYGHSLGGICPYFVNWDNTDHPCATLPVVGKLKKFTIRAPSDDPIHQLLAHVGVRDIHIEVGTPKMSFQFSSPEGTIKFATSKAVGFKFPGFDDEEHGLDGAAGASDDNDDVVFENPESPELLELESGEYETLPPPAY